jgi:hypothetical protein
VPRELTYPTASRVGFSPAHMSAIFDTYATFHVRERFGARADGVRDDTDAVERALQMAARAGRARVVFTGGVRNNVYRITRKITVPSGVTGISIEGIGAAGADLKPELRFEGDGGFDFGSVGGYVRVKGLQIVHSGNAALANGVGLDFTDSFYVDLSDLWLAQWNIDIRMAGNCIYSSMRNVRALYGYTACMQWNNALQNGNVFDNCQFSGSIAGTGLMIVDSAGTAALAFRSCKFEGNFQYGFLQTGTGFINVNFDTCYWETNGLEDCYLENAYPHARSLATFQSCYFDPNNAPGYAQHRRIVAKWTRLRLIQTDMWQMNGAIDPYTVEPVFVTDDGRASGPHIAEQCTYETPKFVADESNWFIVDNKHPRVQFSGATPTGVPISSMAAGSMFFNTDVATLPRNAGWQVLTPGRGSSPNPAGLTGTTTATSPIVTPNDTQYPLAPGDYIAMAGVTWDRSAVGGSATEAYARIIAIEVGPVFVVDGPALASVVGVTIQFLSATVALVPRTVRPVDNVTVQNGLSTTFSLLGVGYALFLISETNGTGNSALVVATNGTLFIVWQNAAGANSYTLVLGTAARINLGLAAGVVTIQNMTGVVNDYTVAMLVNR